MRKGQKRLRMLVAVLLVAGMAACGIGSPDKTETAYDLKTVHIDQTPVKNQFSVGFCWAYSLIGLLESLELRKDQPIDLSEEYLGFYRFLTQLKEAMADEDPLKKMEKITEGNWVMPAFELAEQVGLVPESVFNHKFNTTELAGLENRVKAYFKEAFADEARLAAYRADEEKLFNDLATVFGKKPPKPTDTFTFEDKEYTAISLIKERLEARSEDFVAMKVTSESYDYAMHYVKAALMQHISVPIGSVTLYGIDGRDAVWDADLCREDGCETHSGHAVLVVDFVTEGGRSGEMPLAEAKEVFHNTLDYLIIKNSWGLQALDQEGNTTAVDEEKGFYQYKKSFIEEAMRFSVQVVLPKSIISTNEGIVGAGLKGAIAAEDTKDDAMRDVGEESTYRALTLDVPSVQDADAVTRSWNVSMEGRSVATAGNEETLTHKFTEAGIYDIELRTSAGGEEHVATKRVWVLNKLTDNVFDVDGVFATTNLAEVTTVGGKNVLRIDTREGRQPVPDFNRSFVQLPAVTIKPNGKVKISFVTPAKTLSHRMHVALAGGKYSEVRCFGDYTDDTQQFVKQDCVYPEIGGFDSRSQKTANFRFVFNQMPQDDHKWKGLVELGDVQIRAIKAEQRASGRAYVKSDYPAGVTYKNFAAPGAVKEFSGLFGSGIEAVAVYVDERKVETINVDDMSSPGSGLMTVPYSHTAGSEGFYRIRLVGITEGQESSSVAYELFVTKPIAVDAETPYESRLAENNPFVHDGAWVNNRFGLSPAKPDRNQYPNRLANDLNSSAVLSFDLTNSQETKLNLAAHYAMEKDWDYLYVKVSGDGGQTFATVAAISDSVREWQYPSFDISRYDGQANVVVRIDAVTDNGSESQWVLLGIIQVASGSSP